MSGNQNEPVLSYLQESLQVLQQFSDDPVTGATLYRVYELFVQTYRNGKKILAAGNGGSAADAQHFAGKLVSRFYFDRPPSSAIALITDTSILTGQSGGSCDLCLCVPFASTPQIQECHLIVEHTICACVEAAMFGKDQI